MDAVEVKRSPRAWRLGGRTLSFPPPLAAGIVNVTDDSFYSGARSGTPQQAAADGFALVEAGFDLLDVGAVAARNGPPVPEDVEAARLVPAIERLAAEADVPVLADTFSVEVAARALAAGAAGINDIGGGGEEMLDLIASSGCGYVLMHIEGEPRAERAIRRYDDPVAHLKAWFADRIDLALRRGVAPEQIALDPGFDFDLSVDDDLELMRGLGELRGLGHPLFVALSRKDFLGALAAGSWEERLDADRREAATLAVVALAVEAGAEVLRLHDRSALDAMRVAAAIAGVGGEATGG
ncbi:MAG TPA: dihydropteroate synthase [Solirubrobacterales bacterium]|nr:dihydropteroate synthase [Solirubrobacterales bacterium]